MDSMGFHGASMELHESPCGFHGTLWTLWSFHGTPCNSMELPWNSMGFHRIPWNSMHETPWNSMEFHGVPWNSMKFHGVPWNSMELFYTGKTLISGIQRSLFDLRYRREIAREIQTVRPASKMSRIRNPDWENDENLKVDILKYVLQNLTRREVLDFLGRDYPQYAWSLPTLSRRMAHFGVKYVDYETDLKVVEKAVKEVDQWTNRSMHKKLREQHHLAVPRGLVYDVMTQIDPEGLERRRKVGQKKRHRGPTGTFTSLVRYLLVLFFTGSRRRHDHCFASVRFTYNMRASE